MNTAGTIRRGMTVMAMAALCALIAMPAYAAYDDLNKDGYPDIVFSNSRDATTSYVYSYIYWGAATSPYATKTDLPVYGASSSSIADLNSDGYPDIVSDPGSSIYWGSESGYSSSNKTGLATCSAASNSVADLNGDGYQDIVFSNYYKDSSYNTNSYVYWGAETSPYETKTELPTQGARGNSIADLNNDGYSDIIFSNYYSASYNINSYVYWGSESGYSSSNKTGLPTSGAIGNSVADLNRDGYLDIVFSNHRNESTFNVNSYIYWGAVSGYSSSNKTELATIGSWDNSVVDLNNDGYLDIVFANYRSDSSYNTNSYIYWGGEGGFSSLNKTELSTSGASGSSIADLNGDGYLDIVFSNYYNDSAYTINSYIYWGSASGYSSSNKTLLATQGVQGVSIAGSDLFGSDSSMGTVIPLWMSEGGYDVGLLTSPEYQSIATKYSLLNGGALDLSMEEIAELTDLYADGKAGLDPASITVDGLTWSYFGGTMDGKSYGDSWYDSGAGKYYFYFGSGIEGSPVPEPGCFAGMMLALLVPGIRRAMRRKS